MHKKEQAIQQLLQQKLLPLYYHESEEVSFRILQALHAAGIRVIEYTARGAHALRNFAFMRKQAGDLPGMLLGIGTIKTADQARQYVDAGADFIVCPTVHAGVAEAVRAAGLLWIPGCMTPTEIATAEAEGATLVKLFPGNLLGPSFVTAIKELFPAVRFMPTGGVEAEAGNLQDWFAAGVVAVGMGSKLISKDSISRQDYAAVTAAAGKALQLVQAAAGTKA